MNLNNTQIKALAGKITAELREKEKNNISKQDINLEDYKKSIPTHTWKLYQDFKKLEESYNKKKEEIKRLFPNRYITNVGAFESSLKDDVLDKQYKAPTQEQVINEIVLATIDTSSVEEIMKKVKASFE